MERLPSAPPKPSSPKSSSARFWWIVGPLLIVGELWTALHPRGEFGQFMLDVLAVVVLTPFLLVLVPLGWIVRGKKIESVILRSTRLCAALLATVVVSCVHGYVLAYQDMQAAKQYCQQIIPRLLDHHHRLGRFPEEIEELQEFDPSRLPRLLRDQRDIPANFYTATPDGQSYWFEVYDPRGLISGFTLASGQERWVYYN